MRRFLLIITALYSTIAFSQESFKQTFVDANNLMEDFQYGTAISLWQKLLIEQPDNFNVNFKIGVCYLNSPNHKKKSLDHLKIAAQGSVPNYDPFTHTEKNSPVEAYFYLGDAYHINYDFDKAIYYYNAFKEKITKKHFLFDEVDHRIEQCNYAKNAVANPVNIIVNNMGKTINSGLADYSPVLSVDESIIFFTSRRLRPDSSNYYVKDVDDGKYFEDIYVSYNEDGVWSEPELLNINTEGHEATVNISVDGQTLFIYKDDNGDGNIYTSQLDGDKWTTPEKLGSDINSSSQETHAHISPDGNILYFVSNRKGGLGGKDIYMCKKLPTGEWALAQNMGPTINTEFDEDGIFIHPDGKSMYFSSKGHKSIGHYDIFYSEMDENGVWGAPTNLGYPINSTDDDVFFVTSTDGKRGYYSSFQETGLGEKDIYMINMTDAKEKPLTLLTGKMIVLGMDNLPDNAQITVTDNTSGNLVGIYKPVKRNGKFSIILQPGGDYHIEYAAATYKQEEDLYIPPISAYQEIDRSVELQDVIFGDAGNNNNTDNTNNDNTNTDNNNNNTVVIADTDNNTTDNNNNDNTTPPIVIGDVVDMYQQYFNYNIKQISTSSDKYKSFVNTCVDKAKTGKVVIDIESSASKVPTRTYGSNINLAFKRAETAKNTIIKSLRAKGIKREDIMINDISSSVKGPQYNGDFKNKDVYEKYQYIIIKLR